MHRTDIRASWKLARARSWTWWLVALLLALPAAAQEVVLDFDDGLLPSAHGWFFEGQDDGVPPNRIPESRVASVSGGVLFLDTATAFGVGSDNAFAFWSHPLAPLDPSNYMMEIRMRASLPDGFRGFCVGFLGVDLAVTASFRSEISLMPRQVTLHGAPGSTCPTEIYLLADGRSFHTYRAEVRNGDQATLFVDGARVAAGTLADPAGADRMLFGDVSTSGGNVRAEIDFLRVASLRRVVEIDVRPGSDTNAIQPDGRGVIAVAVLTKDGFDATTLDSLSARFGPDGALETHGRGHVEDADGDGDLDLILHFRTDETGIACGDTTATLVGTAGGQNVTGEDEIVTVACGGRR